MICHYYPSRSQYVERYFHIEVDSNAPQSEGQLILPDTTEGLLFIDKGSICRSSVIHKSQVEIKSSCLFGQKTAAVQYLFPHDDIMIFGAKLRPTAIAKLFGIKAANLTNASIELEALSGSRFRQFQQELDSSKDFIDKMKGMERRFLQLEAQEVLSDQQRLVEFILLKIESEKGEIKITDLVNKYGINLKKLERLFNRYVGLTPKTYCRIIRFNHVVKKHRLSPNRRITDLSYESGFYDQMHFIKECKKLTGRAPLTFINREKGSLEDTHMRFIAGLC